MSRDYKPRPQQRRRQSGGAPGWIWFLSGFAAGALAVGFAWIEFNPPTDELPGWISGRPEAVAGSEQGDGEAEPPAPRFDFWNLLPREEVTVPDEEVQPPPAAVGADPAEQVYLQIGAFTKASDAERRKAEVALLGIEAQTVIATTAGGQTYHRVRSGPYKDAQTLNKVRRQLSGAGVKSLIVRER